MAAWKLGIVVAVGVLALGVCTYEATAFIRVDRCLDRGGRWDSRKASCSFESRGVLTSHE